MRPDQCGTRGVPADHPAYGAVQTFGRFLTEYSAAEEDPALRPAFQARWSDYMAGKAGGPTTPEEAPGR